MVYIISDWNLPLYNRVCKRNKTGENYRVGPE